MPIRVTILGATGSIGQSALDVVRRDRARYEVVGLSAHASADALAALAQEFRPKAICINNGATLDAAGCEVLYGADGLVELASRNVDVVLSGVVGAAGLRPVLAAIEAGNRVALANKEPMVMAGKLIMARAAARQVRILPVDSEHNAIFQCLEGHDIENVYRVHLTASGGPFYGRSRDELAQVTAAQAVRHPTWDMGAKISVDSATLMNKGLEVIEAMWLFGLDLDRIGVVIHPQSVVHSLVEFRDGNILAHLGVTDMRLPIQFALNWPERVRSPIARLDLAQLKALTFAEPDFSAFPCLRLALEAARRGGTAPALLNAANETAVAAFIEGRLAFLDIASVVEQTLNEVRVDSDDTLEPVLAADAEARRVAKALIAADTFSR